MQEKARTVINSQRSAGTGIEDSDYQQHLMQNVSVAENRDLPHNQDIHMAPEFGQVTGSSNTLKSFQRHGYTVPI